MAITNHERIGKCLEQLSSGLQPFVERELKSSYQDNWFAETRKTLSATQVDFLGTADKPEWDIASLLATLWNQWNDVFKKVLGQHGTQSRQRIAGRSQQVGASSDVHHGRCLSRFGFHGAFAQRGLRA